MNLKTKIEVLVGKHSSYYCIICSSKVMRIIRIQIDSDNRALRSWLCEKCFKKLFKYDNWK